MQRRVEDSIIYKDFHPLIVIMRVFGGPVYRPSQTYSAKQWIHYAYCCVLLVLTAFFIIRCILGFVLQPLQLTTRISIQLTIGLIILNCVICMFYNHYAWRQVIPFLEDLSLVIGLQYYNYQNTLNKLIRMVILWVVQTPVSIIVVGIVSLYLDIGMDTIFVMISYPWTEPEEAFYGSVLTACVLWTSATAQYMISIGLITLASYVLTKEFKDIVFQLEDTLEDIIGKVEDIAKLREKHFQLTKLVGKVDEISLFLIGGQVILFLLVTCWSIYAFSTNELSTPAHVSLTYGLTLTFSCFLVIYIASVTVQKWVSTL